MDEVPKLFFADMPHPDLQHSDSTLTGTIDVAAQHRDFSSS
jgi:hypothetical protein